MSRLDPDLRRLLKWARAAPPPAPSPTPRPSMAKWLARALDDDAAASRLVVQRFVAVSAWASLAVVVAGATLLLLTGRASEPASPLDFTTPYEVALTTLAP